MYQRKQNESRCPLGNLSIYVSQKCFPLNRSLHLQVWVRGVPRCPPPPAPLRPVTGGVSGAVGSPCPQTGSSTNKVTVSPSDWRRRTAGSLACPWEERPGKKAMCAGAGAGGRPSEGGISRPLPLQCDDRASCGRTSLLSPRVSHLMEGTAE